AGGAALADEGHGDVALGVTHLPDHEVLADDLGRIGIGGGDAGEQRHHAADGEDEGADHGCSLDGSVERAKRRSTRAGMTAPTGPTTATTAIATRMSVGPTTR